jgi:acyl-CoA dehydrogenase
MNFGFTEEQEFLRQTARDFLAECAPMTLVRDVMESSASHSPEVWKQMAELGWTGLALPWRPGARCRSRSG